MIKIIKNRIKYADKLLEIWKNSVKVTHDFLSQENIIIIEKEVYHALFNIEKLYCFFEKNIMTGFIGIENKKIEMLFIDPLFRNQGIGKQLLKFSLINLDIKYVDVNEQNKQALGFYLNQGFQIKSRSEFDNQGRSYPILHLEYHTA